MGTDTRSSPQPDRSGWLMIALFAIVAAYFVGTTVYTRARTHRIDDDAVSIASNAAPSIWHLAAIRTEIFRLQIALDRQLRSGAPQADAGWNEIEGLWRAIDAEVRVYLSLPSYPGERAQWRDMRDALREFGIVLMEVRGTRAPGQALSEGIDRRALDLAERIDEIAGRLSQLNGMQAQRLGDEIARTRAAEARMAAVLDTTGVVLAMAAAVVLFAFVRRAQRLVSANRELADLRAKELDAFAGRVAHDIKAPIGAALLWVDIASRRVSQDPEAQRMLTRTNGRLKQLAELVDALLVFARAGARPEGKASTCVAEVIDSVRDELAEEAASGGISLTSECDDTDVKVACPAPVLASVLTNLTVNAVKYMGDARRKEVRIRSHMLPNRVRIEVEDTGPGMNSELARDCFEPFHRGAGTKQPGIGLGLATVRRLVTAYGGGTGVNSIEGEGSTFWVELPRSFD